MLKTFVLGINTACVKIRGSGVLGVNEVDLGPEGSRLKSTSCQVTTASA